MKTAQDEDAAKAGATAIVVSYRTGPMLRDCVGRLIATAEIGEIVIVDNGNPFNDEVWLTELAAANPRVRLISGQGNIGYGRACNLGVARSSGATLLFVNPDLVMQEGAVPALRQAAEGCKNPCLVGGRLIGRDGREQRGCRREELTLFNLACALLGLSRFEHALPFLRSPFRENDPLPAAPIPMAAISGALFLMLRANFEAISGFDEGYFLHVEDVDLCRRVREAGGEVIFAPGAVGYHEGATSEIDRAVLERFKADGYVRYFRKFARSVWARLGAELAALVLPALLTSRWTQRRRNLMAMRASAATPPPPNPRP